MQFVGYFAFWLPPFYMFVAQRTIPAQIGWYKLSSDHKPRISIESGYPCPNITDRFPSNYQTHESSRVTEFVKKSQFYDVSNVRFRTYKGMWSDRKSFRVLAVLRVICCQKLPCSPFEAAPYAAGNALVWRYRDTFCQHQAFKPFRNLQSSSPVISTMTLSCISSERFQCDKVRVIANTNLHQKMRRLDCRRSSDLP